MAGAAEIFPVRDSLAWCEGEAIVSDAAAFLKVRPARQAQPGFMLCVICLLGLRVTL